VSERRCQDGFGSTMVLPNGTAPKHSGLESRHEESSAQSPLYANLQSPEKNCWISFIDTTEVSGAVLAVKPNRSRGSSSDNLPERP
jgi:hypothetical protein